MGAHKNGPHEKIKELAIQILRMKGYEDNQIFQEYSVSFPMLKKPLVVDVVGINAENNRNMAIECGITPSGRLSQLQLFFDEVMFIPFVSSLDNIKDTSKYENRIRELENEVGRLTETVEKYREKQEKLITACSDILGICKLKASQ